MESGTLLILPILKLLRCNFQKQPHSVHALAPPPPSLSEAGWASNQIFKKGSLTGPQLLEGGWAL